MNNQNVQSNQTEHELDPSKLLSVFRIYWGWILMVVILATTAAVIYTSVFANKIWSTSVQFYVWMNSFDSTDTQTQQITTSQFSAAEKHAQSAIEILKTKTFRKDVIGISELSGGHDVLISGSKISDVPMFTVKVSSTNAEVAFDVAQAIVDKLPGYVEDVTKTGRLSATDFSGLDTVADSPSVMRDTIIAAVFSFVVAYVFFFLKIVLDTVVHTEEDVRAITDYPILGGIPSMNTTSRGNSYYYYSRYSRYSGYSDYAGYSNRSVAMPESDSGSRKNDKKKNR